MHRRRFAFPAAVSMALLSVGAATPSHAGDPPIGFSHTVIVDPQRLGGEPIIKSDPDGGLYESSILGFSNGVSLLWKSEDKGAQWDLIQKLPNAVPAQRPNDGYGGGDSEIVIGPKLPGKPGYTVSFYDLESLADIGVGTSYDSGASFETGTTNPLAGHLPGTDRQWGAHYRDPQGRDHLYLIYNDAGAIGATIVRESLDWGTTWTTLNDGDFSAGALGALHVDPANGYLYFTSENGNAVDLVRSTDGGRTLTARRVRNAPFGTTRQLFIGSDLDSAGNPYVAWSEPRAAGSTDIVTYVAVSTDKGLTFSPPVRVSPPDVRNANFPWIVAGDPGRVDVVFYGSTTAGSTQSNKGPWNVYLSQSIDLLDDNGAFNPAATVQTTKVSEHTNHVNPICLAGLGCTAGSAQDRNLSDFFQVDVDPQGAAIVIWNDTANQIGALTGSSVNAFARQLSGPSLYTSAGNGTGMVTPGPRELALGQVGNAADDTTGDALTPAHSAAGPGPNNAALDLKNVTMTPSGDNVVITAQIADGSLANAVDPTVGPSAFYVVSWWSGNKNTVNGAQGEIHFVGMQTQGVAAGSTFYGGSPAFYPNTAGNARFIEYIPSPTAPVMPTGGSFDPATGRITWTIPKSQAGLGGADNVTQLFSVTGTSLQGSPVFEPNATAKQADATPPFTFTDGPDTVVPEAAVTALLPLIAAGVIALAVVARRRRSLGSAG
ncbi:MAG: exo-alpha-sialidase [Frankiaceae bacterium]|nr:exo-alpha-sialidase [Frankiaceae bacterium]